MKRKILIIVNTCFQLMTAVQLIQKKFTEDETDLMLTDHLPDCEHMAERITESGVAGHVYTARCKIFPFPAPAQAEEGPCFILLSPALISEKIRISKGTNMMSLCSITLTLFCIFSVRKCTEKTEISSCGAMRRASVFI